MKRKPSIFVLAALLLFFSQTAHAQNRPPVFPRLEPDPKALEFYSMGSRASGYTWAEYAQISLWASGGEPSPSGLGGGSGETSTATLDRIRAVADALNNSTELPSNRRERAEFILTYMHSSLLRSYSLYQTRVDTIFSNGRYNCVSSAVLYMILCESAGLNTSAVVTRDHAFVVVSIDGQNIDVETTNRYGFDPGSRREFHDNFGTLTGFTYVPAHNYRDRRAISKIELISLIFINRIADHERQNRYADSVPVAIDLAALLLGAGYSSVSQIDLAEALFEDPRKVVMDRLFNYGASLLRANREEDGILWAETASARYAYNERWQEFIEAAVNNRVARFLRERDVNVTAARNFLEEKKNILTAESYAQLDTVVVDAEILKRANQIRGIADGDSVISDALNARENGRLPERRANELIVYAVQKTAAVLCAAPARDWRAAISYIESFISRNGGRLGISREFDQALRTYRDNIATDYHNRFAAEWNRRNFDEAQRILEEGLAEFPDNRQLLTDRETVNRMRN